MEEKPTIQRHFLSGGGEMGERIRNFDWSKTPLGNPETWESSLKTCVRIMLTSPQPMFVWWGDELINIYNDAFRDVMGIKHPSMLGISGEIAWKEIWDDLSIRVNHVFEKNEGTFDDALLLIMNRYGYDEETYFKFSYNPIPGIKKTTEGLFCVCTEETQRIINERSLDTLRKLGAIIFTEKSLDIIYRNVAEALASNNKDFPFALIYKITGEANIVTVAASTGIDKSQNVFPETIDISKPTAITKDFCEAFRENIMVVSEIRVTDITLPTGAWQTSPTQFIYLPVSPAGGMHPYCIISAALNPYRTFDETYKQFCQLIGDRVSIEINKMLTLEIESKRAETLAEIDRAKIVFFSNISHEFRTPLTLMLGPLETILHEKENNLNKSIKQNIEIAQRNALLLLKLVNTLLDFSNIERGKQQADFSLVDIVSFTKILTANFRSLIEKAGMKLIVKADTQIQPVYVDKLMWQKIVFNLLSNAFKYTLRGKITVEFSSEKDFAVLKVKDTGVGIPENELPKMFDRFHRIENSAGRTYEGTGIGLSLIKELVKLHNGEISVESALGEGSVFTVKIPFGKGHVKQHQIFKTGISGFEIPVDIYLTEIETLLETENNQLKIADELENNQKEIILLVDDNADMRQYLRSILSHDFKVITAINGMDALNKVKETIPALVIADIMMPVLDGFGLLKELKGNKKTETIPVIFLTALASEDSRINGWETGVDDYLVKPFSGRELLSRVNAQLKTVKLRQSLQDNLRNLLLQSPVAIAVLKGPDHVFDLANAMYLHQAGKKEVLGKSIRQAFPEMEGTGIFELLDQVYSSGEPFVATEMLLKLDKGNEMPDEKYFNFVYQPSRESDGKIDGVIMHGVDVTEQVLARKQLEENERKQAFLLKLSDALRPINNPQEIEGTVTKIAMGFMDADRCYFNTIEDGNAVVSRDAFRGNLTSLAGVYPISSFPLFKAVVDAGQPFIVDDVYTSDIIEEGLRQICVQVQVISMINVPVIKNGKTVGVLSLVQSKPRKWTDAEVQLTIETAERTWAAVESAKAEAALRKSEEKYRSLFTSIDQGFTICELIRNEEGKAIDLSILEVNPTYEKQTGISKEMVIGKPLLQVFPTLDLWIETYAAVVDNQLPVVFEQYFKDTDRWFSIEAYPIEKERFAVLFSDISESKKAEQKIQKNQKFLELIINSSPSLIFYLDNEMRYSLTNDTFKRWFNAERKDVIGKTMEEFLGNKAWQVLRPYVLLAFQGETMDYETEIDYGLQGIKWIHAVYTPDKDDKGQVKGIVAMVRDITNRKHAEQRIQEGDERLRLATQTSGVGIWEWNVKTNKIRWDSQMFHIYGIAPTADGFVEYSTWRNAIAPEDLAEQERILEKTVKNAGSSKRSFKIFRANDGMSRDIEAIEAARNITQGETEWVVGTNMDITEQKRATEKIAENEKQFSTLANNIQNLAWIANGDGWVYWYNQRWYDYTGTTLEEMEGWGWQKVHHPDHVERIVELSKKLWITNEPFELTFPLRRYDGEYRWFLTRAVPISDENGNIISWIGTNTDIHDQKLQEEKKDVFISIASHEMKTPLTTAKAYIQLLELTLDENDEAMLYAKKASQSVNRLEELTSDLLDVSKIRLGKLNYTISTFNFNDLIDSTVENMQLTTSTHTIIKSGNAYDEVTGDKDRLQQVVINLLSNAIKYSPNSKNVYLTVEQENDFIKVSVKDTGIGIAPQSLTKIFEKYHRVEEDAVQFQGLGIGLFISYEIIERHNGKLWAESEPGKGSTFYFSLPVSPMKSVS